MLASSASSWVILLSVALTAAMRAKTSPVCSPDAFPYPELLGIEITSLSASERHNYSTNILFAGKITGLDFCNVSILYTHPGTDDSIHVQIWLPLEGWNLRFQGTGGGGYATGDFTALAPAVAQGVTAVTTDGGHAMNIGNPES